MGVASPSRLLLDAYLKHEEYTTKKTTTLIDEVNESQKIIQALHEVVSQSHSYRAYASFSQEDQQELKNKLQEANEHLEKYNLQLKSPLLQEEPRHFSQEELARELDNIQAQLGDFKEVLNRKNQLTVQRIGPLLELAQQIFKIVSDTMGLEKDFIARIHQRTGR